VSRCKGWSRGKRNALREPSRLGGSGCPRRGYEAQGADEIVFLDIAATNEGRDTLLDLVRRTAERLFIPLTVGGGMRRLEDIANALRAGADKVAINSAAVSASAAGDAGSRAIRIPVRRCEYRRAEKKGLLGGLRERRPTADRTRRDRLGETLAPDLGAGEILLTSIDRDGGRSGYDIELLSRVSQVVSVPVVASGGAGSAQDVVDAFVLGGADAAPLGRSTSRRHD